MLAASGKGGKEQNDSMLQEDELAILCDYNSDGNNEGHAQAQPADLATKDIIIEYDEYEK